MCGMQVSIMGLLANDPATVPDVLPWTPCNFNPNRFISGNNIFLAFSGPTEQFRIHEYLSLGARLVYKAPPPTPEECVRGGGADIYSMILPKFIVSLILMNMQMR